MVPQNRCQPIGYKRSAPSRDVTCSGRRDWLSGCDLESPLLEAVGQYSCFPASRKPPAPRATKNKKDICSSRYKQDHVCRLGATLPGPAGVPLSTACLSCHNGLAKLLMHCLTRNNNNTPLQAKKNVWLCCVLCIALPGMTRCTSATKKN